MPIGILSRALNAKSLEDVRGHFDRGVDQTIKRSLTLFGPIMLVLLAGTFVLLALAFYLPLFPAAARKIR